MYIGRYIKKKKKLKIKYDIQYRLIGIDQLITEYLTV